MTDQNKSLPAVFSEAAIPVDDLAEWLCLTPRRVQQLEKKGITVKNGHGEWLLKVSVQSYIRELNTKADGKNTEYHKHRTKLMKLKAEQAEIDKRKTLSQFLNADAYQRAREEKDGKIKQRLLAFEKVLPQKTGGMPAEAQVPIIRNEIRKLLTELAAPERPLGRDNGGRPDLPAPAGPDSVAVGGREAEVKQ